MLLSYFDESGDQGRERGSATYTLGGVLLDAERWPEVFERVLDFRRSLRDRYGLLLRHEVKATYLIRGGGDLKDLGLSPDQRREIWEAHFRLLSTLATDVRVFGVVIAKERLRVWRNPRDLAWEFALQRLRSVTEGEDQTVMILHDEGDDLAIRQMIRKARRLSTPGSAFGSGYLGNMPLKRIVDDGIARNSSSSYLVQMADLVAYAAFRTVIPAGASGPARVCNWTTWELLDDARWADANRVARGDLARHDAVGVVVWPKQ